MGQPDRELAGELVLGLSRSTASVGLLVASQEERSELSNVPPSVTPALGAIAGNASGLDVPSLGQRGEAQGLRLIKAGGMCEVVQKSNPSVTSDYGFRSHIL